MVLFIPCVIFILTYIDYYDNTTEPVIIPSKKPVISEDNAMPTYAYYIIGIGSAVLIIALGLAICCCSYTCYVKWQNAKTVLPSSIKGPWGPIYSVSSYLCIPYSQKY